MNLLEVKQSGESNGRTVLVWGPPRTGKTRWAATIAKAEAIDDIFFFDLDNGYETIIHSVEPTNNTPFFTDRELSKINIIRVRDTPDTPRAIETLLRLFSSQSREVFINPDDGKMRAKNGEPGEADVHISPAHWCSRTAIIIDSIGQLGISAFNLAKLQMGDVKDQRRLYQFANQQLNNFFSMIKASNAYVIATSHVLLDEVVLSRDNSGNPTKTRDDYYPLCLSKPYSMNVAGNFGSVIYRYIELNKFSHVSTPNKKRGIQAGTRTEVDISSDLDATLPTVLKLK